MVNFGLNSASILGIILAVAGAALYFLRSVKPDLARDHDIFFAAVGLLCGFILLFQGWRLDPILQFGQLLLSGATIFFAIESIRLRSAATEFARRNTPIVDEDRPVSRRYQQAVVAELDELEEAEDDESGPRRIRPSRDTRSTRDDDDDEYRRRRYDDEDRRPTNRRSGSTERLGAGDGDRQRKRRPRPASRPVERPEDDEWSSPKRSNDEWGNSSTAVSKPPRSNSNGSSRSDVRNSDVSPKPRKRRPPQDLDARRQSDFDATPTDYVDYRPVDRLDDAPDNPANSDE